VICDHAKDSTVEKVIDDIFTQDGHLDILVNNAFSGVDSGGGDLRGKFWDKPFSHWDSFHVVGLRSHYIATVLAARRWATGNAGMPLVVNISSAAGFSYIMDVAYGVGKAGVDRLTADSAKEMKDLGVAVVSVWPGAVRTEVVEKNLKEGKAENPEVFADLESPEMTGRGIVALASDPQVMRWTGRVVLTPELAEEYGFTDTDGKVHWGAGDLFKTIRQGMQYPPSHWRPPKKSKGASIPAKL
jgi:dehydrogenase/reductase SDR family protein 1